MNLGLELKLLPASIAPAPNKLALIMELARTAFAGRLDDEESESSFIHGMRDSVATTSAEWYSGRSALGTARLLVASVVNLHLRGVFHRLEPEYEVLSSEPNSLQLVVGADSLMSCIYQHAADLALGGAVLECRECGTPFVRRHARQVFCPAPPWRRSGASACAERWKKREQRRRGRAG